ncbi:cytochrome C oxidase subunit IV family protein [Sphingomonas sp. LB3N6]|uniref:cytochrome o ubiquinol oxidase subunit IV n=1 Tax=Sphingomonas fucosidasi TaxID=3096164 RepID=UPI002FCCA92A
MSDRTRELRTYAVGYGLSLVLTVAAFAMVRWPSFDARAIFGTALALGLVQMAVQFRCFLHISLKRSSHHDLQLILFSTLIIALMVSGTLVVLFNLRGRMTG